MPPPWLQGADPNAVGCVVGGAVGGPPCLRVILFPAALYLARSYSTTFLGIEPSSGPKPAAAPAHQQQRGVFPTPQPQALRPWHDPHQLALPNAHTVLQRLMGRLPRPLLAWFLSKVLNLSDDTTRETLQFLENQTLAAGQPALQAAEDAPLGGNQPVAAISEHGDAQQQSSTFTPEPHGAWQAQSQAMLPWSRELQAVSEVERRPANSALLPRSEPSYLYGSLDNHQNMLADKMVSFAAELKAMVNETAKHESPLTDSDAPRRSRRSRRRGGQKRSHKTP
jgi:hypothetical protein